jgi:PAS domain S-box-containing protein
MKLLPANPEPVPVTRAAATDSEQHYRCLFDCNPASVVALDLQGHITEVNPAVLSRFGHAPADLIGQPVSALVPDWDRPERLAELLQQDKMHEAVLRHAHGQRCEVMVKLLPSVVDGTLRGYFLIARDVTQLRRWQRQLQVQAEVIARTHDAVVVLDEAGAVVSWNQGAVRVYGASAQAMAGQPFDQLFEPAERARLQQGLDDAVFSAQAPTDLELRRTGADGQPMWLLLSLSRIAGIEPGRELVVVHGLGITARHRAEAALREALAAAQRQSERQLRLSRSAVDVGRRLGRRGLLQHLADDARLQVGAHQAAIWLLDGEGEGTGRQPVVRAVSLSAKYQAWRDAPRAAWSGPALAAIAWRVLDHGAVAQMSPEQVQAVLQTAPDEARPLPLRGWLAAPMFGRDGGAIGLLQLSDRYEGDFDEQDRAVVQQLAQLDAAAVETDAELRGAQPVPVTQVLQ